MSAFDQHLNELLGHFNDIETNEKKLREKLEVVLCQAYRLRNRSNSSPFVPATRGEWNTLYFNPDLLDKKFELSRDNVYIPTPASPKPSAPTPSSIITTAGGEGGGGVATAQTTIEVAGAAATTIPSPPPSLASTATTGSVARLIEQFKARGEAAPASPTGAKKAAEVIQAGTVSEYTRNIETKLLEQNNKVQGQPIKNRIQQQQPTFSGKGKGRRRRGGN